MALTPGARVGAYEVVSLIGAGGMGEVYRAHDPRLSRDVALKVMPDVFAADPERLARFRREAQVLAALNHPNIASIHGFEESDGVRALVLELVEGETLAERLARGAIPVSETLPIAKQIAEALEAAHELGIIHRDLKPANVKATDDGRVKVLDFGLAKLLVGAESPPQPSSLLSLSPTITTPAATGLGVILGTAAYMSPEQAKGRVADKRSDVWAFGCLLFEMLTGQRAFEGDDVSDTLASILKGEPDWSALPSDVDNPVRELLRACLTRDRRERLGDVSGARFVLEHRAALAARDAGSPAAPLRRRLLPAVGAAVVVGLIAGGLGGWLFGERRPVGPVSRFAVTLGESQVFSNVGRHVVAMAPDGTRFVYTAANRLNIRALDQLEAMPLQGTEGTSAGSPREPFFSPDGQWIGYAAAGQLRKISVHGGAPVVLCASENPNGATWGPDNTILFASNDGIWSVSGEGGTPQRLLEVREGRPHGPQMLPGGRAVLFTLGTPQGWADAKIVVQPLDGSPRRSIAAGTDGRYVPSGHIVYVVRGVVLALPFELDTLSATGGPIPVVEGVAQPLNAQVGGAAHFSVSSTGTLVYVSSLGGTAATSRTLVWVDRKGKEEPLGVEPRAYVYPRLSPDGSRIAIDTTGDNRDIWVWDVTRRALSRLTSDPAPDRAPVWTPDGRQIIFSADREGAPSLFALPADGTGAATRLTQVDSGGADFATSISPDGKTVLFRRAAASGAIDVYALDLEGKSKPRPVIQTPFRDFNAEISPDGRWVAYQTDVSGRMEIRVRPYGGGSGEWPVSTAGGVEPLWARDSRELFYRSPTGDVLSVLLKPGDTWTATTPKQVLVGAQYVSGPDQNPFRSYDVSRDGRFLMMKSVSGEQATSVPEMIIVQNWFEELKRRAPSR